MTPSARCCAAARGPATGPAGVRLTRKTALYTGAWLWGRRISMMTAAKTVKMPKPLMLESAAGEEDSISNWSRRLGVSIGTMRYRVFEKCLSVEESAYERKLIGI